jgi:hypothetical protein
LQKIQLDLSNHPVKNLLSEKVRLGKIEIIRDKETEEEQISIDFSILQPATKDEHSRRGSIIAVSAYPNLN